MEFFRDGGNTESRLILTILVAIVRQQRLQLIGPGLTRTSSLMKRFES